MKFFILLFIYESYRNVEFTKKKEENSNGIQIEMENFSFTFGKLTKLSTYLLKS